MRTRFAFVLIAVATVYGSDRLKGRAAIRSYLRTTWGNGRDGLSTGGLTP